MQSSIQHAQQHGTCQLQSLQGTSGLASGGTHLGSSKLVQMVALSSGMEHEGGPQGKGSQDNYCTLFYVAKRHDDASHVAVPLRASSTAVRLSQA